LRDEALAKSNPARFRPAAEAQNRRKCARGCGKISFGVFLPSLRFGAAGRVSVPTTIKSKSSGRGSFKTFFARRPNSFSNTRSF
jgi:hypothetical protein